MSGGEKPESGEAALETAKGYYQSEMGNLYGPAHAVIETLARELESMRAREPLVQRLLELWLSDDDNLSEIQCALEDLSRWKP